MKENKENILKLKLGSFKFKSVSIPVSCLFFIASLVLFLALLPLSNKINFMQNDDWVYYQMIENFMKGDFKLSFVSAPTFYTQGILGMLFSFIFGINHLPLLTLFISVCNFYIFSLIIFKFFKQSPTSSILLSLLFFFNPLHIYSIWGFMTENYFLFFMLLSFYFFLKSEEISKEDKTKSKCCSSYCKYISLTFVFITLGFFIRQVALVIPLTFSIYLFLKGIREDYKHKKYVNINININYKKGIYFLMLFIFLLSFYQFIFPKTFEMLDKGFYFGHFGVNHSVFSLFYGIFIVLTSLTLPIILFSIDLNLNLNLKSMVKKDLIQNKKKLFIFSILFLSTYLFFNTYFKPQTTALREFPYFENVWEQKGFFPGNLGGTKYHFMGMYDLYKYWDLLAKVLLSLFLSYLIIFKTKKLINLYSIFFIIYLSLMSLIEFFYDRYILVLIPLFILFILSTTQLETKNDAKVSVKNESPLLFYLSKLGLLAFVVFLVFYSYCFSMDYILVNKYVWDKGKSLGIEEKMIQGTNAWKMSYRNINRDYIYDFSWDKPKLNDIYTCCYDLIEEKAINYPFNIFVDSKVYLYKRK